MSRILIVTPAPPGSRKGNRLTANRWARLLRSLGHRVEVAESFDDQRADLLVALHARKSAASVRRHRARHPESPIVVALTGTDLYQDLPENRAANESLTIADRLIVLQPLAVRALPREHRATARTIFQSVEPVAHKPRPLARCFEVAVSGHLRDVKDPFRAAMAVRSLPEESRIQVTHLGGALTASMERRALREANSNPRYRWLGELPQGRAVRTFARSRLLVISSKHEGCPNVLSEALANDTPVLATRIDGNVGLLGEEYEGYFPVGDTQALRTLLLRCEREPEFLGTLREQCRSKAPLVAPQEELMAWSELLNELF